MARKRMNSKIQPAVETLVFSTPQVSASSSEKLYIDLSQCASIMNRRFYRQGINWAVSSIKILTLNRFEGAILCSKLPNTWVMSNAWEKMFRAWRKQQEMALDENDSVRAKFNDFKIFADDTHLAAGYGANLLPLDAAGNMATAGEWQPSQIVIPNFAGTPGSNYEPFIQAVGDDVGGLGGSVSLIKAYEDSRSVPQSPDPAITPGVNSGDNVFRAMFDVGSNMVDVLENASETNDELPYPQMDYPGGDTQLSGLQFHDYEFISPTTVGGTTRIKGGNFPCGLMKFEIQNNSDTSQNVIIQVDLVPGSHRGYLCEPMTEM